MTNTTGARLKQKREELGWTKNEFAAKLSEAGLTNFHPTTIGRLERDEQPLRLSEAVTLAAVLNIDLAWLATGDTSALVSDLYAAGYRDALAAARKSLDALR